MQTNDHYVAAKRLSVCDLASFQSYLDSLASALEKCYPNAGKLEGGLALSISDAPAGIFNSTQTAADLYEALQLGKRSVVRLSFGKYGDSEIQTDISFKSTSAEGIKAELLIFDYRNESEKSGDCWIEVEKVLSADNLVD